MLGWLWQRQAGSQPLAVSVVQTVRHVQSAAGLGAALLARAASAAAGVPDKRGPWTAPFCPLAWRLQDLAASQRRCFSAAPSPAPAPDSAAGILAATRRPQRPHRPASSAESAPQHGSNCQPASHPEITVLKRFMPVDSASAILKARMPSLMPRTMPTDSDLRVLCAARRGGEEEGKQLLELLRRRRSISLFNAALKMLPPSLMRQVLWLLCKGGDGEGGGGGKWPRPTQGSATAVQEQIAAHPTMQHELDSMMQQLLDAGLQPHYRVWLAWAKQHADAGRSHGVRHVMRLVEERSVDGKVTPHYYVQLARAYCACGRWNEAEPLLAEMSERGVPPNEHVYRALIWCYGRHQQADRAQQLFDEMAAAGVEPSMVTWSALLNAYADSKQPYRAVKVLVQMRKAQLWPSMQAYGALTKAFARSGEWQRAVEVLELMNADGVQPNEQVFGSIVEAAAVAGKPGVAAEVMRRMAAADIQPNVIAYTSFLSSYGATGDVEAAIGVMREMEAAGCPPNGKTFTALMSQLAAKGMYKECEVCFNRMVAAGWSADRVSLAILIDSMLQRWAVDREGQQELLGLVQTRWNEAAGTGGVLAPHTYLHQPQGRSSLDLHGYSAWTAQLAVLSTLDTLLRQHSQAHEFQKGLARLDIIVGRGKRSKHRHRSLLRELVLELLQHLLPVSFAHANDGLLVLKAEHLRRLFDAHMAKGQTFSLQAMQHCLVDPSSL